MMKMIRPIIVSLFVFTVLTGIIYPLGVTGIAQMIFPAAANGSIMMKSGRPVGSSLIGQPFDDPKYFWGRLSATVPFPYNSAASSGSNLAQGNPALKDNVKGHIAALKNADPQTSALVPVDLVTASGSGLDPHISPSAAAYQIRRVASQRHMDTTVLEALVSANTEPRQFGLLGEPVVNVLKLNLALDALGQK